MQCLSKIIVTIFHAGMGQKSAWGVVDVTCFKGELVIFKTAQSIPVRFANNTTMFDIALAKAKTHP